MTEPLFGPYEAAVEEFLRSGGHEPSLILSPSKLLKQYRAQFGGSSTYAHGVQIKEAPQDHVSVTGTNIAGHIFEWPEAE